MSSRQWSLRQWSLPQWFLRSKRDSTPDRMILSDDQITEVIRVMELPETQEIEWTPIVRALALEVQSRRSGGQS